MLVLSRKIDEEVCLGDDIRVKVIEVRGGVVRLGFTAPANVAVHRKEVWEEIQRDKAKAAAK